MNESIFVLFGATGDLAKRKIIPAIYKLLLTKKVSRFAIIGAALEDITIDQILERAKPFCSSVEEDVWQQLKENSYYIPVNFNQPADFDKLAQAVTTIAQTKSLANRLIYFATPALFYCTLTEQIARTNIARRLGEKNDHWYRLIYEKPFGYDLKSAHEINTCIAKHFNEIQIYRIDHYLTKELVSNISLVRFTNCILEPLWNHRFIDNVQIILSESEGIDDRGLYYDHAGALRDVVQNHMLEMLALVAMETPEKLTGDYIRTRRAEVLKKVVVDDILLGQYNGYLNEKYIMPDSSTETFVVARVYINNQRWHGVPFYLKTGKALDQKATSIHIKFKQVDCLLTRHCFNDSNYLTIEISPRGSISLTLNAKKVGTSDEVAPVKMEFCHSCLFGPLTPDAYETLLEEIIKGEHSVSVKYDEIEYAWNIIDAMHALPVKIYRYEKGSQGPEELQEFNKKHGIRWRA